MGNKEKMICDFCGCEFNGAKIDCPNCNLLPADVIHSESAGTIRAMVTDVSGQYVRELDRKRCSTCLRRLSCQLVSAARKAKPGQLIAGLVVEGRNLRCRQFKYAGGNRRPPAIAPSQEETNLLWG